MASNTITANYANDKSMQMLMAAYDNLKSMQDTIDDIHDSNDNIASRLDHMLESAREMKAELEKKFGVKVDENKPISLKNTKENHKDNKFIDTTAVVVSNTTKTTPLTVNNHTDEQQSGGDDSDIDFISIDMFERHTPNPTNSDTQKYQSLIAGAKDWDAPKVNKESLRKVTRDTYNELSEFKQRNYVLYHLCMKDFLHREKGKNAYCNPISMIAYNVLNHLDASEIAKLNSHRSLPSDSEFIKSGLFLYKSADDNNMSATVLSDCHLNIWVPKKLENEIIEKSEIHVEHQAAYCYPVLSGVIMSFNNIKKLLLNNEVIVYLTAENDIGMHTTHSCMCRDISTNNYWITDSYMTSIDLKQYDL